MIRYGVYDTQDSLWLGNAEGPLRYEDEELALAAATIIDVQMGWLGRTRALPIPDDVNKMRDELPTKMTALEAIRIAEGGHPTGEQSR